MAAHQFSRGFALRGAVAVGALAVALLLMPMPHVTDDKLLTAVFGGAFLGVGIGLSIRGGAVLDGTEVLAIYASRKLGISVGDVMLTLNLVIFTAAAIIVDLDTALYAILTYLSAARAVDFILHGIEEYTSLTIISDRAELLRRSLVNDLHSGVTVYRGRRGYGKRGASDDEVDILYTVVTRLEVFRLKAEIAKIDPDAFIIQERIDDTTGGYIRRRATH